MAGLEDYFELISLSVDIYHNARVCGEWRIQEHTQGDTCFHMATQDEALMVVPDVGEWHLKAGDLVIFPREIPHTLKPIAEMTGPQQHLSIAKSQHISGTSLLCGKVHFIHSGSDLLLDALPSVLVLHRKDSTPWLSRFQKLILDESLRNEGMSNVMIDRLCELLFAYAIRYFVESGEHELGVLSLFRHHQMHKVIQAIHTSPDRPWQLNTLATCAAMSRTQFAHTFKSISGWTPMQYITWWRMQLAWRYLASGLSVANAAEKVGYQSEAAFSRAFKKQFNESAGQVRRDGKSGYLISKVEKS